MIGVSKFPFCNNILGAPTQIAITACRTFIEENKLTAWKINRESTIVPRTSPVGHRASALPISYSRTLDLMQKTKQKCPRIELYILEPDRYHTNTRKKHHKRNLGIFHSPFLTFGSPVNAAVRPRSQEPRARVRDSLSTHGKPSSRLHRICQ